MAIPRLKQNDNNIYPGPEGAAREREFLNETNPKDIFTEYCIQLADIDEEIAKLLDTGPLGLTADGNPVPVVSVDNERWAEFSKTWQLQNGDNNISPPIITVRRIDEQPGTLQGQKWTIPNRKHFTTLKVPTFENGIRGVRLFQMTQPTQIDAIYEVRLIALLKQDISAMTENFLREYNGRQLYINVKGMYFPSTLEDLSKEDTMEEIDADRYYVSIFNIKVQCSIQRLEDFREIDLPNRIITLTELQGEVIAQTSQTIIAPNPEPPRLGVNVSGAPVFTGGNNNGNHGIGNDITDFRLDNVTKELFITTKQSEFMVDLSDIGGDSIESVGFNQISNILTINTKGGARQVDLSSLAVDTNTTVTSASFNSSTRVLTIGKSDGTSVTTTIPLPVIPPSVTLVSGTYSPATKDLTLQDSEGDTVIIDLSQVAPDEVGDTIESVALDDTTLTITTDKGTHDVDLSTLNPLTGATTLDYFQGFTPEDVTNITNEANWNLGGNGEYTGPALTTNHRAVHEIYATVDSAGAMYSTDGQGRVNRYFAV